ncbi:unnamed protein product [Adineta ricciae]|uniref:Fucosyltransferase n=1 Tax=Adineta ricciae TaxID=249248 RepID=A0A814M1M4_ADIRI|nr:unnamed protein product [Adineta ricciae]CAF1071842.1 unnamed protein product [Adineta ricciae]
MRLTVRYLCSIVRYRRRFSILLLISALLFIIFILSIIDRNHPELNPLPNSEQEIKITTAQKVIRAISTTVAQQNRLWPLDEQGRSLKNHFFVFDATGFFGSAASEGVEVKCESSNTTFTWTRQPNQMNKVDFAISHDARLQQDFPFDKLHLNSERQQYSMAFIMESEAHSSTGDAWANYNFRMSYNLDDSYPEPATYFDVNIHIIDLLTPPVVKFEKKETRADVVWIISNCDAHNGRQGFIEQLMKEIKIDSYGLCLNNRQGYGDRMTDNVEAYMKYKFVIAIENSNCIDYVTEKLVKAVESGSVPIVAGRNGRPDYRRFMPDHSYINIFDYPTVKALADDLKRIANNKTLYESYLWFKKHKINLRLFAELSLNEKIKQFTGIVGSNATMIKDGIVAKEKSENKICKLIRFVRQTPWQEIATHKRAARPNENIACLQRGNILDHFRSSLSSNGSSVKN